MSNEEKNYDDPDHGDNACERCGDVPAFYGTDPYAEEICGDDREIWLCRKCIYESVMDI